MAHICYNGQYFLAPRKHFGQNFPLNSGHPMIGWEKRKHIYVFIRHISSLSLEAHNLIFPSYFSAIL